MATTKTTTKKTPAKSASASASTAALQAEVNALREQVTTLQNQLAASSTADTSNMVTKEQLAAALRSMGAREWVITKAGLR